MAAELPRCAVCRVSVEIGQPVTFRPDGRVQHTECPSVVCPVCTAEVRPGEPIRRDDDRQLLHPSCWIKRARAEMRIR